MLRHKGKRRTFRHNIRLASLLSGVAGIVNISGLLSLNTLTTNVTGHFAFLSEQVFLHDYGKALVYLFYILFFFLGAFVSGLLMELIAPGYKRFVTMVPVLLEMLLLTGVALFGPELMAGNAFPILSCTLLFSMGLQNALVTKVSESVVRTTHLTGLFTDLGIDLSQLVFRKNSSERHRLSRSVFLKGMIIACFFAGGIIGGVGYQHLQLGTLYIAIGLLGVTLFYDQLLFRYFFLKRRLHAHQLKRSRPT